MDWSPVETVTYILMVLLWIIILRASSSGHRTEALASSSQCHLNLIHSKVHYEYYKRGDFIIGGLFSVMWINYKKTTFRNNDRRIEQYIPLLRSYAALVAFTFAVDKINKDPELLPNITLGYHAFDAFGDEIRSVQSILQILSGLTPNYSCRDHGDVVGFVGYTFEMQQILQIYSYTMINYGVNNGLINNDLLKLFFTMALDVHIYHVAIVLCLKHFGWNWVGIIIQNDDIVEAEVLELIREMRKYGICTEYIVKLPGYWEHRKALSVIEKYTSQVIIIYGSFSKIYPVIYHYQFIRKKTLILSDSWFMHILLGAHYLEIVNCSLSFSLFNKPLPELWKFIYSIRPNNYKNDELLQELSLFFCLSSDPTYNRYRQQILWMNLKLCSDEYFVTESIYPKDIIVYYVYTAVYVLAHALHEMIQLLKRFGIEHRSFTFKDKLKLLITRVQFMDYTGETIYFNEKRQLSYLSLLEISNWIFHPNVHGFSYTSHSKSFFLPDNFLPKSQWIHINDDQMKWKTGAMPQSQCNEKCPPGSRKASNGGYHICCYDCVPCSEGEMSNLTDSEFCYICPEDQWPNPGKTRCVTKLYEFLSYEDNVSLFFAVSVVFCVAVTCYVIRNFIIFWDTPLVRANNRTVSFILLASILLTLLCVFLFIGCPLDITCQMRQTTFGVLFSVTVSSILAKTIMVCISFKAIKPGSSWRKLVEVRLSYYIVVICSSVQVLICVIWLASSPPYQDFDYHSYLGKIIIQCNEGFDFWFYSVLGYLGFLAAVSFVLAFMVRTLPDSFNEAKYITFSMLLFCSVWIAMIPAYLSTRGKYMVAVEIFAILASSAGILISIFFPKCYILIKKPELNSRKQLAKPQNS